MQDVIERHGKLAESAAKLIGLMALVVYGLGYIIVSIRNSTFGFTATDLLKPWIAMTGLLFAFLVALPAFAALKTFPKEEKTNGNWEHDKPILARKGILCAAYFNEIIALSMFKAAFIEPDPLSSTSVHVATVKAIVSIIPIVGMSVFLVLAVRSPLMKNYPKATGSFAFLCFIAELIVIGRHANEADSATQLWLLGAGLLGAWIYRRIMSRELPIGQTIASSWIVLFAIVFYAELVYPHLYQMWGGGHPTPVAVATVDQETHKVSSLVRGQLLDEDSSGIYLQFNDQTAAVFVPKGEISRICFLERTQVHSLTELILPQMLAGRRASAGVSGCTP